MWGVLEPLGPIGVYAYDFILLSADCCSDDSMSLYQLIGPFDSIVE